MLEFLGFCFSFSVGSECSYKFKEPSLSEWPESLSCYCLESCSPEWIILSYDFTKAYKLINSV